MVLTVTLAAAISTILDILTVATLSDRGVNTCIAWMTRTFAGSRPERYGIGRAPFGLPDAATAADAFLRTC